MLLSIYFVKYNRETLLWQRMQIYRKPLTWKREDRTFVLHRLIHFTMIWLDLTKKSQTKKYVDKTPKQSVW